MKNLAVVLLALFLCLISTAAAPQRNMSPPPPSMDPEHATPQGQRPTVSKNVDLVQLQREADVLARTAQTIPVDVANVRKGMLPKDVIEKLKQIEKLSKHLRTELNP